MAKVEPVALAVRAASAIPMLVVTKCSSASRTNGRANTAAIRSAAAIASRSVEISSQHQAELVTAEPGHRIARAKSMLDQLGDHASLQRMLAQPGDRGLLRGPPLQLCLGQGNHVMSRAGRLR